MAELLRLDSTRFYGNSNPGCVWGLFHMFDSYQRRETKKMLSYRRMRGSLHGLGTDILIHNDDAHEDREVIVAEKGQSSLENSKTNKVTKISSKARILNFIANKVLKRQNNKEKISHSSSHISHTHSIHPSESSNFVLPEDSNQTSSFRENSTISANLDSTDSPTMNGHKSMPIKGLISGNDIRFTSQKLGEGGNYLLDEHIILKKKLFEARDALLKKKDSDPNGMTIEFSLLSKIFLDTLQLFNANKETLYSICQEQDCLSSNDMPAKPISLNRSASLTALDFQKKLKAFEALPDHHLLKKEEESKAVLSRWKELKQRLKGMLAEDEKVGHRISMDRILDKVPSGRKMLEDEDAKVVLKYGNGFKFVKVIPRVQRSLSLTESMGNYSQLLDSFTANEVRKFSKRSKSTRDGSNLLQRKLQKNYQRMLSNPETLRSHSFSQDGQSEVIALEQPLDSDLALNISGFNKQIKDLTMNTEFEENSHAQKGKTKEESNVNEIEEQSSDLLDEQVSQVEEDDLNSKSEKTSPISVLNLIIEEPASPEKFGVLSDSNLELSHENIEDHEEVKNDGICIEHDTPELLAPGIYENSKTLFPHMDEKESSTYNYVKHILAKSGFEALLCQTEPSSMEFDAGIPAAGDMPFEENLIYDLINEVLFEIYEYSSIPSHWIARFHSKIRSMPKGSDLIEEAWTEIRWRIFSPMGFDAIIDAIIARNFSKNDGWMCLYRDAECFGLLLEQLILDDLVDELLLGVDQV